MPDLVRQTAQDAMEGYSRKASICEPLPAYTPPMELSWFIYRGPGMQRLSETMDGSPRMLGRFATLLLACAILAALPASVIALDDDVFRARDEDLYVVSADDDDDDGGTDTGNTGTSGGSSGKNSNDGTNSRHTGVSRDRDRSRGDLTKDRTKDGPGGSTRDRSRNHTNDKSRNDTR